MHFRITVEALTDLDDRVVQVYHLRANDIQVTRELGISYLDGPGMARKPFHNGQERFMLKGWSRCSSYDGFVTEANF